MDMFLVVIQLGAILAVVCLYFHKLNPFSPRKSAKQKRDTFSLWGKVLIATIPAGIIGVLFDDHSQNRSQLDDDQEHIHKLLADVELDKLIHQDHMPGAGDRQPFRDPLYNA